MQSEPSIFFMAFSLCGTQSRNISATVAGLRGTPAYGRELSGTR